MCNYYILGKLSSCLEDLGTEIDLDDIVITLDVICLTLPEDVPEEHKAVKPAYERTVSHTSQLSHHSVESVQGLYFAIYEKILVW